MRPSHRGARPLHRDRRGGITIMLASSLFMLAGAATVAVDLGSVYLARRQLQGVADAAALAANAGGRTAAEQLLVRSGIGGVELLSQRDGQYARDPSVPVASRFTAGASGSDGAAATELVLRRQVPLFFARLLVGRDRMPIEARAIAARSDMAAFSIGTGLASVSGGVPNALLSALAGTQLNLSVMDYQSLVDLNVDLLGFAGALRTRVGAGDENVATLFDRDIPVADVLSAIADTSTGIQSATVLRTIANRLAGRSIRLGDIIDMGPAAWDGGTGGSPLLIDAASLLRMILGPAPGEMRQIALNLAVPGLAATRLVLALGGGQAHSPLLTVTAARDVIVRTAQTRLYLESSVGTPIPGLFSLRVPVYAELAAAEARLSAIDCTVGSSGAGVTLAVTPSVGSVALADVDVGRIAQPGTALIPRAAVLAQAPAIRVQGYANVALGGTQPQSVHFTPADIAAGQVHSVSTNDLAGGIAASLTRDLQLQVSVLGITTSTGPLANSIGTLLGTTAPLIDGLLNGVTGVLGVRIGTADVRVHQMRCGQSTLVA